jgi:hypothetical protein
MTRKILEQNYLINDIIRTLSKCDREVMILNNLTRKRDNSIYRMMIEANLVGWHP